MPFSIWLTLIAKIWRAYFIDIVYQDESYFVVIIVKAIPIELEIGVWFSSLAHYCLVYDVQISKL